MMASDNARLARPRARDVHVWRIELVGGVDRRSGSLSPAEWTRLTRLRGEERTRFAISHGAVREVLGGYLGCAPADVPLESRYGHAPRTAGLELSLTHCEQLALFAVALTAVGIDLEARSHVDADDLAGLSETTLAPAELRGLLAAPAQDRPRMWLSSWVRKEAVLKAHGGGLADRSLTELDVSAGRVDGLTLVDLDVGPGYLAAVAITPPAEEIILRQWVGEAEAQPQ